MNLHKEISFETEVCDWLGAHGWLYESGDAERYDRARALYPADLVAWVQASQPKAWEQLASNHGSSSTNVLLDRVRKQLDDRGALDVLRHGVEMLGLKQQLMLAQFRPALAMNADIVARYEANRLRVVRQVRYSPASENCIDLGLFLNGLPVATVELKTDFTQSVQDAVDQYRFDRPPHPKGQNREPLLSFPSGGLVHFAVSNNEVPMTTRLEGAATRFMPFNKGNDGGAGNKPHLNGHPTSYLWEEVWERDSWLEILGRYIVAQRDAKRQIKALIFPRYHQLDATCWRGAGTEISDPALGRFRQDELHRMVGAFPRGPARRRKRETVLDRDRCLRPQRDRQPVSGGAGRLRAHQGRRHDDQERGIEQEWPARRSLAGGKKIIVCTIQTFPFALEAVRQLAATEGKRFAVIADEAHSSQTGEAAAKLKAVLSPEELAELTDGGEVSSEDILVAQMAARAERQGNHLRRLHGHAKGQDDGALRPSPELERARERDEQAAGVPRLFDAAGDRGGLHPRRAEELHSLQARLPARPQRQGV
jgi:type I restriction enzyme, R subunit